MYSQCKNYKKYKLFRITLIYIVELELKDEKEERRFY